MNQNLKKNYILNTLYQILVLIVPVITTPYISKVLGASGIGTYSFTYSIVSYFVLFSVMGTTTFGQRSVAFNQNNKYQRSKVFFEVFLFRLLTTGLCIITYTVLILCLSEKYMFFSFLQIFHLVSIAIDISWLFQGMEDFGKVVYRNSIVKILTVLAIFMFVRTSSDLWKYTLILSGMTLLGNLSIWRYIKQYIQWIKFSEIRIFKNSKEILQLFLPSIAIQVYTMVDKTMLGVFSNDMTENGYYEQIDKIIRICLAITTSLGTVLIPRISNMYAQHKYEKMIDYIKTSFRLTLLVTVPIMFGIIAVSKVFVPLFYGEGFEKLIFLLPLYSLIVIPVAISNVAGCQYLVATKKQNAYTMSVTFSAIINFIMNIYLIPRYYTHGAIIASIFAESVGSLTMLFYIYNIEKINMFKFIFDSKKYFVSGFAMCIVVYHVSNLLRFAPIYNLFLCIILGGSVYIMLLIILKDSYVISNINFIMKKIIQKIRK